MRPISRKFLLLIFTFCIPTVKLSAQAPTGLGKITGKIVDAQNNEGIPLSLNIKTAFGFKKMKKQEEQGGRRDEESF